MPQRTETDAEQTTRLEAKAEILSDSLAVRAAADILVKRGNHKLAEKLQLTVLDWLEQAERMKGPMRW